MTSFLPRKAASSKTFALVAGAEKLGTVQLSADGTSGNVFSLISHVKQVVIKKPYVVLFAIAFGAN